MTIPLCCECGKELRLKDEHAGKRVKCPECGRSLSIPTATRAALPTECHACGSDQEGRLTCAPIVIIGGPDGVRIVQPTICARCASRTPTRWFDLLLFFAAPLALLPALLLMFAGDFKTNALTLLGAVFLVSPLPVWTWLLVRYLRHLKRAAGEPEPLLEEAIAAGVGETIPVGSLTFLRERLSESGDEHFPNLAKVRAVSGAALPEDWSQRLAIGVWDFGAFATWEAHRDKMRSLAKGLNSARMLREVPEPLDLSTLAAHQAGPVVLHDPLSFQNELIQSFRKLKDESIVGHLAKLDVLDCFFLGLVTGFLLELQQKNARVRFTAAVLLSWIMVECQKLTLDKATPERLKSCLDRTAGALKAANTGLEQLVKDPDAEVSRVAEVGLKAIQNRSRPPDARQAPEKS